jgi:hypothetical protein
MAGINNYMQQLKAHKFRIYPTTEEANQNIGQIDLYNKKISDAIADMGINIPTALQKMTSKIERSGSISPVSHRSGQAARDLYSRAVVDLGLPISYLP